ncbi:hypothetical protein F5884DRAFT_641437, partial [Xylogone sp. PMI_703]
MRYENWDVILQLADGSEIPFKEFRTECKVTLDPEMLDCQSKPPYMPTMTCFTPSLPQGQPFAVSVHAWERPEPSLTFPWEPKCIVWEIRIFIDGVPMGSRFCGSDGPWPMIILTSSELDKNGHQERLKFPGFHQELLNQSYWDAGDDIGRIRVVITEGIQTLTVPPLNIERLRNVVSFSFQHAPLNILELSEIAWPNAAMWRPVSSATVLFTQPYTQQQICEGAQGQVWSPHRRTQQHPDVGRQVMLPACVSSFSPQPNCEPLENYFNPAFRRWRQPSSSDVSMHDYSTRAGSVRHFTDPASVIGIDRESTPTMNSLCEGV